jgi:hypothetical protein
MLRFEGPWRYESPGPIPSAVSNAFEEMISRISGQGHRKYLLEHFKAHFAAAAGMPHNISSDVSWAETDLQHLVSLAGANAPVFIDAFYSACQELAQRNPDMELPDLSLLNRILSDGAAGYEIRPPVLVATRHNIPIAIPERSLSLSEQAHEIIQSSLAASERLLAEGTEDANRRAVQEILWLLETVTTAFRGIRTDDGTVQGNYFNRIIGDLRTIGRGRSSEQILGWMMALHGYLSAPSGGGVRHGLDLRDGAAVRPTEARLYCNLIRSYITFLIMEHERLFRENDLR